MSEVDKMYENANVKKQIPDICSSNELYCKECKAHIENAMPYCKNAEYPPFTAEKQLELIKWLLDNKNIGILKFEVINGKYEVYDTYYECDKYRESLDEALADYICCLWQDLTDQERTEIADILKG